MNKTTSHVATIAAFPNKFGSFTGAVLNTETREALRERFATIDEAKFWAKKTAWDTFGPIHYAAIKVKGEYRANCWHDNA